ncbi:MAG: DUF559 domain-containing protein [Microbacteriaceae bacterium]|nr:DUF559 domain-containing protein [Microbacteriaceae bacterium]
MDPAHLLRQLGGIASRQQLLDGGATEFGIGRARHEGRIVRVRRAWYALPGSDPGTVAAVRVGGMATCVTLLASEGLWVPRIDGVHVSVAANASRLRSARSRIVPRSVDPDGVVLHWRRASGATTAPRDSVVGALAELCECADVEGFIGAADSAVRQRRASLDGLRAAGVPTALIGLIDPSSESGGESAVRLRLRRLRIPYRSQVSIVGVGRVDFLIGQRLVIEVDGYEFHSDREAFESDRERDRRLAALGYIVIRVTYRQLQDAWHEVERSLLAIVRSGRHLA